MKWQMNENSLFAVLLRSPWWISFAIAGALADLGAVPDKRARTRWQENG